MLRIIVLALFGLLLAGCGRSVAVAPAPISDPETAGACSALIQELPDEIAAGRSWPVQPDPASTAAWGTPTVVLTCGDPGPTVDPTEQIIVVDGVEWVQQPLTDGDLFRTVGRDPEVIVRIPADYRPGVTTLAELGPALAAAQDVTQ